ncbi:11768_t:CDS:2 [Dentiscutata erythropus]|uniref:11768_t:CDS:1 n=1 Tax=Dentiscutata erythropus TaxID=1348616 RepID=A0A9N9JI17_9GLOM|nr:11768_t:CDS:2 [Dentiscutata erythropus]
MKPERLQFIKIHGYLSYNKSGTQPATTNDNDYTKSLYYVEIAMYLYLMTKKQMDHQVWTPSIQYFKEEIFEKYILSYLEEWTIKGKITNNRIKEQFPNQEIFEEYKTLYDSDEQNNSAEKPNYL